MDCQNRHGFVTSSLPYGQLDCCLYLTSAVKRVEGAAEEQILSPGCSLLFGYSNQMGYHWVCSQIVLAARSRSPRFDSARCYCSRLCGVRLHLLLSICLVGCRFCFSFVSFGCSATNFCCCLGPGRFCWNSLQRTCCCTGDQAGC